MVPHIIPYNGEPVTIRTQSVGIAEKLSTNLSAASCFVIVTHLLSQGIAALLLVASIKLTTNGQRHHSHVLWLW
jgi:hypothetical protein